MSAREWPNHEQRNVALEAKVVARTSACTNGTCVCGQGTHLAHEHAAPLPPAAVRAGPCLLRRGGVVVALARRGRKIKPFAVPQVAHAESDRARRVGPRPGVLEHESLAHYAAHGARRRGARGDLAAPSRQPTPDPTTVVSDVRRAAQARSTWPFRAGTHDKRELRKDPRTFAEPNAPSSRCQKGKPPRSRGSASGRCQRRCYTLRNAPPAAATAVPGTRARRAAACLSRTPSAGQTARSARPFRRCGASAAGTSTPPCAQGKRAPLRRRVAAGGGAWRPAARARGSRNRGARAAWCSPAARSAAGAPPVLGRRQGWPLRTGCVCRPSMPSTCRPLLRCPRCSARRTTSPPAPPSGATQQPLRRGARARPLLCAADLPARPPRLEWPRQAPPLRNRPRRRRPAPRLGPRPRPRPRSSWGHSP